MYINIYNAMHNPVILSFNYNNVFEDNLYEMRYKIKLLISLYINIKLIYNILHIVIVYRNYLNSAFF